MKRYVIGDVHGCHFELCELIARILMDCQGKDYKLIFVGDYVDRGPKSKEVVDLVRKLQSEGHVALMGNHEDMIMSGELMYAAETLRSYNTLQMPEDVLEWMRSLPKYYEDDTIIVAHAGVLPNTKMEDQSDIHLLWYRYQDYQNANLDKHFYHGHTPKLAIEQTKDRTNVDTACVYGGKLTAAIVGNDGKPEGFIQVPAQHSVHV